MGSETMAKKKKRVGNPKKAVGYVRVSTEEQNLGPEAQRAELQRWAAREGVELVAVFEDIGVSGKTPVEKRPGLLAAFNALEDTGSGVLIAAKRDRLARDVLVVALVERMAERAGARALAADDDADADANDPSAFLMRAMKDAFAQYERLVIVARTRAALGVKKARGERTGDIPIGRALAADGIHLAEHPAEAAAVGRILELRGEGLSIRAIAEALNAEGVAARGTRWHKTTVERVLLRHAKAETKAAA